MRPSLPAAAALAALLSVAVIGCASGPDAAPGGSGAAPATQKAAVNDLANLPTGARLQAVLAPKSFFPAGFEQGASKSGTQRASSAKPPAKPDCTLLNGTGWVAMTGIDGVSFAQTAYENKATSAEEDEQVFAYASGNAAAQLTGIGTLAALCPAYPDAATHSTVKVTERATTGVGDGGYTITLTDPAWQTGSTLEAVKVGNELSFVYSTTGPGNGAAEAARLSNYLVAGLTTLR